MRTLFSRGGHDNRDIEGLSDGSVGKYRISVEGRIEIPCKSIQADLQVENDQ
jgi:hypothetical protein